MSPLMEALAHDHRQRLLDEAAAARLPGARRPGRARRAVGAALIRVGTRLARPQPVVLSPAR